MENKLSLDFSFSDIRSWARPILKRAGRSQAILTCPNLDSLKTDLQEIISFAYHMNFVEDSDPSMHLPLNLLAAYPGDIQLDVISALRSGQDLCGYIAHDLNDFTSGYRAVA